MKLFLNLINSFTHNEQFGEKRIIQFMKTEEIFGEKKLVNAQMMLEIYYKRYFMQFFELFVHLNDHNLVDSIQFTKNYLIVLCFIIFCFGLLLFR